MFLILWPLSFCVLSRCSSAIHSVGFCGNQSVHLKFLNQNGRHFRPHYMRGPIDTVGVVCTYGTGVGARQIWGTAAPPLTLPIATCLLHRIKDTAWSYSHWNSCHVNVSLQSSRIDTVHVSSIIYFLFARWRHVNYYVVTIIYSSMQP